MCKVIVKWSTVCVVFNEPSDRDGPHLHMRKLKGSLHVNLNRPKGTRISMQNHLGNVNATPQNG